MRGWHERSDPRGKKSGIDTWHGEVVLFRGLPRDIVEGPLLERGGEEELQRKIERERGDGEGKEEKRKLGGVLAKISERREPGGKTRQEGLLVRRYFECVLKLSEKKQGTERLGVGSSEGYTDVGSILEESGTLLSIGVRSLKTCIARASHLAVDTFMTLEFSSYIQISDCHLRTMCLHVFRSRLSLESHSWRRVGGRLIRSDSYPSSDSSVEMSDELASTLASIQEFMAGTAQTRPPGVSLGTPFHLADHYETIPPPTVTVPPPMVPTIEDTRLAEQEAKVERLESMMRQIRLQDGGLTWDDRDGIPAASLPAKFRMPDIERYSGIGCPKIHLRLYSTVMRAHGIDDAQLVALFPMSLSGAAQRRELEATRQRPEESISSFVTRWRAKVAGMVDRPKEQDQIDMVLRNLQPRFARRLVGIPFQDLRSLVQAAFSVEEAIARGLWTDTTPSPDSKGKKLIGPFSRSGEHAATTTTSESRYSPAPRPYAQRPARQFTPLGMTLTRAFEKLRDAGVIVPLAPRPLPHPIPPHFRSHEHCLYHQIPGHDTERCSALHHAIQDLIDSGVVDLARPSVTTNPLPTHSTHAVPPPPGEDLVQSAWIHHYAAVYFRAHFHPDYGHHQSHFPFC
ncbi:hypothetical protein CK203_017492 [Vitis vinifera]|uniref:Retrotransposon gag domain-containing protein n=1 Tax=Vitis vinifera TaxID=29760 RepID=A0A438IY05_VITVI|nr:hypothetical protein CK203_017492 [Vitis vinifera]